MSVKHIPGWSRDILPFYAEMARTLPHGARFVEVGVFLGRSFAHLASSRPDIDAWAVDPWLDDASDGYMGAGEYTQLVAGRGGLFASFLSLMRENCPEVLTHAHIIRAKSTQVRLRELADLVFIDGAHDYLSVREDIEHWLPVVKPGGIIAGHDYVKDYPGVIQAVDEAFGGTHKIGPVPDGEWSSVWWVQR